MTTGSAYVHPTGDGYMHLPPTGTDHNGYILVAGETAGSALWKKGTPEDVGAAAEDHKHTKAEITDLVIPTKLPNPNSLTVSILSSSGTPDSKIYDGSAPITIDATPAGLQAADRVHTHEVSDITNFPSAIKNPYGLNIALNGVSQGVYDGSAAVSMNVTPVTIGAAAASHTHTKSEITDFPDTSKTENPLNVKLGSASADPISFNGEKEVTIVVSPTAIGAAERVHTHVADDISGLPTELPNPSGLTISMNGTNSVTYTGSESQSVDITAEKVGAATASHTHPYAGSSVAGGAANSVASQMRISLNGGGSEGVSYFTYDGSAEKTINITPAAIGASASDHTHLYAGSKTVGGVATEAAKTTGTFEISLNGISAGSFDGSKDVDINITPAAIGASASDHTHSYAGSSTSGGAANSAVKWDKARDLTIEGDINGVVSIDGSSDMTMNASVTHVAASVIDGVLSIDNIPKSAIERCVVVADDDARFALTKEDVQKGDTIKVTSTNLMYFVVDDNNLDSEKGYESYSAGQASSVPWSGVTGKPTTYPPATHTHTKSQITDFPTTMKNPTALTITVGEDDSAVSYDGSAPQSVTITPSTIGAALSNHTHYYAGSSTIGGAADSALMADQVNHNITISLNGNDSKSFNGSKDVVIDVTPNSIGASAAGHTHPYAGSSTSGGAANSVANSIIISLNGGTTEGNNLYTFDGSSAKSINIAPGTIGAAPAVHGHTASEITGLPTALKNPNALTISLNGTNQGAYDGSASKSINITPASIGASASNHTHSYAGSSAAGGAANSVAKSITVTINNGTTEGTDKWTFNGSVAKTINLTPGKLGVAKSSHTHTKEDITDLAKAKVNMANYVSSTRWISSSSSGSIKPAEYGIKFDLGAPAESEISNTVLMLSNITSTPAYDVDGVARQFARVCPINAEQLFVNRAAHAETAANADNAALATAANKVPVPVGTVMFSMSSTSTFFSSCFGGTWEVVGELDATINNENGTKIVLYMFKKTAN